VVRNDVQTEILDSSIDYWFGCCHPDAFLQLKLINWFWRFKNLQTCLISCRFAFASRWTMSDLRFSRSLVFLFWRWNSHVFESIFKFKLTYSKKDNILWEICWSRWNRILTTLETSVDWKWKSRSNAAKTKTGIGSIPISAASPEKMESFHYTFTYWIGKRHQVGRVCWRAKYITESVMRRAFLIIGKKTCGSWLKLVIGFCAKELPRWMHELDCLRQRSISLVGGSWKSFHADFSDQGYGLFRWILSISRNDSSLCGWEILFNAILERSFWSIEKRMHASSWLLWSIAIWKVWIKDASQSTFGKLIMTKNCTDGQFSRGGEAVVMRPTHAERFDYYPDDASIKLSILISKHCSHRPSWGQLQRSQEPNSKM